MDLATGRMITAIQLPTQQQSLFANGQFDINGIIHQNTDQDMFRFSMPDTATF